MLMQNRPETKELAEAYQAIDQSLLAWLERKLGDRSTAEDIAQNVFLAVWLRAREVKIENPAALMYKVANDLTKNEYKRRARRDAPVISTDSEDCPPEAKLMKTTTTPESSLEQKEALSLALAEIERLPQDMRKMFKLNRFSGLSYPEIALQMNVSVSTVEKNMMKALVVIRATKNKRPKQ